MERSDDQVDPPVDWRNPQVEEPGLQRYVRTLRAGAPIIGLIVLVTTLIAGAYVATAPKRYQAEADLLVNPVSDEGLSTLSGLIRSSSDPTRDVETASRLVTSVEVAGRVKTRLRLDETPEAILRKVRVEPVAQSNIVAITAQGPSPKSAADLANGFGEAIVADRTAQLHAQVKRAIAQLSTVPAAARGIGVGSVTDQLSKLQQLQTADDPTLTLETRAAEPTTPVAPRPLRSIAAGIFAGLLLGIGGVFALQVLDPRLRREEQLHSLYRLPILARIPEIKRRGKDRAPIAPHQLSMSALESFRTLRITLAALRGDTTRARPRTGAKSLLVTSPGSGEGKSTIALNLAASLAQAGSKVILIEADLHRPSLARALGVEVTSGTGSVLLGTSSLEDALLVQANDESGRLRLLLSEERGASVSVADRLFLPAGRKLLQTAKQLADYVIIDSPPLASVIDALPLAQRADEVIVVVHLGRTQLVRLRELGDLLSQHSVTPVGFVAVGVPAPAHATSDYARVEPPAALDRLPVRERPRRPARRAPDDDDAQPAPARAPAPRPVSRQALTGRPGERPSA